LESKTFNTAKNQVFFLQNSKLIDRPHCYRVLMRTDEIEDGRFYPHDLGKPLGTIARTL